MTSIVALLDKPSRRSFGLLPLVTQSESGTLLTEGLFQPSDHEITIDTLEELVHSGHALRLSQPVRRPSEEPLLVALWIGRTFESEANELSLPLPPRSSLPLSHQLNTGTFCFMRGDHAYQVLEVWLQHAARLALEDHDARIAKLMAWVLPDRDETRAALWGTADDPKVELAWFTKLLQDRGEVISSEQVADRLKRACTQILQTPQSVVAFTGRAKCGDKEVAARVAEQTNMPCLSFGEWLKQHAIQMGEQPDRPILQRLGQSLIDRAGAMSFCMRVLAELAPAELLGWTIAHKSFVLEGVRHKAVLEAIRFLVGPGRLKLVATERPDNERRALLREEESIENVDEVMSHATESEIDDVAAQANIHVQSSWGITEETQRVLELVGASAPKS